MTTDPDHKFDLSLQLDDLDAALEIARNIPETEAETKWKAVGDRALAVWRFDLAQECYQRAGDLNAQMLILMSIGDRTGLTKLAKEAGEFKRRSQHRMADSLAELKGLNNLAFATWLQLGETEQCVNLLAKTGRAPEAALFARTYAPR